MTEAIFSGSHLEVPKGDINIFGDRPLLRKLEILLQEGQSELSKAIHGLHIPFSQLTELALDVQPSPHTMLCILGSTPNPVQCSIRFGPSSPLDDPVFDIVLTNLANLDLVSYEVEILIRLLHHLALPYLL